MRISREIETAKRAFVTQAFTINPNASGTSVNDAVHKKFGTRLSVRTLYAIKHGRPIVKAPKAPKVSVVQKVEPANSLQPSRAINAAMNQLLEFMKANEVEELSIDRSGQARVKVIKMVEASVQFGEGAVH